MEKDKPIQKYWRPAGAFVYFSCVIFDYIIRPIFNSSFVQNKSVVVDTLRKIKDLDPTVQIEAINAASKVGEISPILPEYFHIAFGAILGTSAYTRGKEKIERVKKYSNKQGPNPGS